MVSLHPGKNKISITLRMYTIIIVIFAFISAWNIAITAFGRMVNVEESPKHYPWVVYIQKFNVRNINNKNTETTFSCTGSIIQRSV